MPNKLSIATGGTLLIFCAVSVLSAETIIPGLVSTKLEPELKGQVLIEELNCAACHSGDAAFAARSKKAPRLADVGSRVNPNHLEAFIRDPQGAKPGTAMPNVLGSMSDDEKAQAAKALTHFLVSLKKSDFAIQTPDAVAAHLGEKLFHSRGCSACHSPRDAKGVELMPQTSVPLGALDQKYSFKSLTEFLRQPLVCRPSGRMPNMQLRGEDSDRIAHFLLQNTRVPGPMGYTFYRGPVYEGLDSDKVKADRAGIVKDFALSSFGMSNYHNTAIQYDGWINISAAGKYTFFLQMNGGVLLIDGKQIVAQEPSNLRGVKSLKGEAELAAGWRKIQLTYFHTGHDPKFVFEMEGPNFKRQAIPSSMLSISNEPIPVFEPLKVDAQLAARGREMFGKLGCANCHNDLQIQSKLATAFAKLDASRGCLSDAVGAWPRFNLNADQRGLITKAMPHAEAPQLDDKQRVAKSLVTFNCTGCHERKGLGGVAADRNALFTSSRMELGDQGRIPPPLTHVGAKLNSDWIAEVMLRGQRQRGYVDASMPQFGEQNVGHLVELFGKVDELEAVSVPKIANVQDAKNAGCEIMGTNGMSCVACHDFNGQPASGAGALDIVHETERVKKNWFHLYMREPARFHPTGIMPSFWPEGVSTRPKILGGDSALQIEALWVYLEDGIRVKKPTGLSRQSSEIRVGDVTEVTRGHSTIGYRGIAVGYPERISLAFDSEEMALRQLWKNDFASVDLGSFHPRGTELITFPRGIPFHRLKSLEDSWPYKAKTNYAFPQDQGYQFRGYHLDAARRPTFLYHYGDIAVEDYFEDAKDKDGKAYFKRTMRFDAPTEQTQFYFRAATGKKITKVSERAFEADQLQVRIISDHTAIKRDGDPGEILIPLTLPKGRSTLTLEYQW